ncbi:MAG TPA: hypothetical protein VFB74_21495 [Kribbellaceae bacterium]|nr:hypothetical protein [Kribbellaceae bacterium]
MSTQGERRMAELDAKLGLLREELAFWRELAAPDGVLERHHAQLHRLSQMLGAALDRLDLQRYGSDAQADTIEQLLAVHHVWNFFRSKLALRLVVRFEPALIAADELARACVQPLYDAALAAGTLTHGQIREPLAYFDSVGTPFAPRRGQAYRNLLLGGLPDGLVRQLPVPVIGVPWHEQAHLPEIAVVAHEVAHLADDDLGLTLALRPVLERRLTTNPRSADWSRWFPEVLADVLATLRLGPAYGQALADLVAAADDDRGYPPPDIRLRLVTATLDLLGLPAGPVGQVDGTGALYLLDVADVVSVILSEPLDVLGHAPLRRFAPFTTALQTQVIIDAERLRAWVPPHSQDPRLLVAAGILAFSDDPDAFVRNGTAALVFARIAGAATRAPGGLDGRREAEAHDRRLGADLLRWVS